MVLAIRRGKKTQTRRVASDNPNSPWYEGGCGLFYPGPPSGYAICPGRGKSAVGRLQLTEEPRLDVLGAMDDEDGRREGFEGWLDFQAYWERLHGRFDPKLKVWVISFEVLHWDERRILAMIDEMKEKA